MIATLIFKIDLNYTEYFKVMQDVLGPEQICKKLFQILKNVMGIKELKVHDITHRKKLFTSNGIIENYSLLRVKVKYLKKKQLYITTKIVYPSEIVRYVRKTLDIIKEIAYNKYVLKKSLSDLENIYCKFDFCLKSILLDLKRTTFAFGRFLSYDIVVGLDVGKWLKTEQRSFSQLVKYYREKFEPLSCPFRQKLTE